MAQRSTSQIEKILTHIYVRDAQKGFRPLLLGQWCGGSLRHVREGYDSAGGRRRLPGLLQHRGAHFKSCTGRQAQAFAKTQRLFDPRRTHR